MQTIDHQGKSVAYYLSGGKEGLPVVLLHGFCEDARLWDDWLPLLPSQQPYLRIDLPGFGQSELPAGLSIEGMAGAVQAVLSAEGIEKCVLVGHSMGGYVSLAFAEKHAGKLAGLCLFHSQPFADSAEKQEARLKSIDFIDRNGHILYVRQLIPKLFDYDYSKGYQAEVNRLIYHASKYDPQAIKAALEAMRQRPDRSETLRRSTYPVQFIIGKQDAAVPYETSLAMTHLPDVADIQIYNDIGHMGMFEAPRKTAKAFRQFLRRLEEA